jgi:hypothetical protein
MASCTLRLPCRYMDPADAGASFFGGLGMGLGVLALALVSAVEDAEDAEDAEDTAALASPPPPPSTSAF